ncbi:MAG: proline-rich region [Proteobacteria bacterium]|nr:proline-rich region [Pseudomonadota bacterium]
MADRKMPKTRFTLLASALLLGACTVLPTGPTVMVLPGTGQSIERFREDDQYCRQYAHIQIGGKTAGDASRESAVTSAAVGAAVGAVAGAAIGGDARGAATGAGVGLLLGTATGADAARSSGVGTQRQYDSAYIQCMYTKGHRVPVPANMATQRPVRSTDAGIPPPPPGAPPPPPPGTR